MTWFFLVLPNDRQQSMRSVFGLTLISQSLAPVPYESSAFLNLQDPVCSLSSRPGSIIDTLTRAHSRSVLSICYPLYHHRANSTPFYPQCMECR
ncbi:sulfite reductase beta subunit [Moniliophthora roreri]|nr:sulfite reductase beta subunit [Moniliophthora roreri]